MDDEKGCEGLWREGRAGIVDYRCQAKSNQVQCVMIYCCGLEGEVRGI